MYYQVLTCLPSGPLKLRASVLSQLNKYTLKKRVNMYVVRVYAHMCIGLIKSTNRSLGTHICKTGHRHVYMHASMHIYACKHAHICMQVCTAHMYKQPHSLDRIRVLINTHSRKCSVHNVVLHMSTYHMAPPYSIAISTRIMDSNAAT